MDCLKFAAVAHWIVELPVVQVAGLDLVKDYVVLVAHWIVELFVVQVYIQGVA
ncbi:MAG: hypothetical protein HY051_02355 [Candidatus Aenigmarchaeota archaeon]|nr:hypothetical protein [Candidatus Aenigmarchaeota archaeon]